MCSSDLQDNAIRMILNYGHTLGHAIEKVSNHAVTHGYGVALGMVLITRLSIRLGLCDCTVLEQLCRMLKRYHLPTDYPGELAELAQSCLHDKKMSGDTIRLVVVPEIGSAKILPMPAEQLTALLKEGLPC